MPIGSVGTGTLPPYTFVPKTGPTGILPASQIGGPGIPPPYNNPSGMSVHPAVPLGEGYISRMRRAVARLDLINGFDQTTGKTRIIRQGRKVAQASKNLGNFSTAATIGPLAGPMPRMFSAYF